MLTLVANDTRLLSRSAEFTVVTLVMPVAFFLLFAEIFGSMTAGGLDTTTYMMISMAAFGAISAALTTGSRVSMERKEGWIRQLRLTPLRPAAYVGAKIVVAMLVVLPVVALVLAVGLLFKGVDLSLGEAAAVLLVIWLASAPFAALGVVFGMASSPEAASAMTITAFLSFAVLGGLFMPYEVLPSVLQVLAKFLPSYWMGDFGRAVATGGSINLTGVVVLVVWTVTAAGVMAALFQRDSKRV